MVKDINGNELKVGDEAVYLGCGGSMGLLRGVPYEIRSITEDKMVRLYGTNCLVSPRLLSKVIPEEHILVEITQAEYDELHEELALKDSLIEDLQAELDKLRKDNKLDTKGIVEGSVVKLRPDSEWNDGTSSNPLGVVGKVINIREDDKEFPVEVRWDDSFSNVYHYRDLELA